MGLHAYYLKHKKSLQGDQRNFYTYLARVLSVIFSLCVSLKNAAYNIGLLKPKKAPLPVISIGNIAIGGSGKTPFCIALATSLKGLASIGIISRGYGGKASRALRRCETLDVCTGHGPRLPAVECGDEPYLIARMLPKLPFVVGKERLQAAKRAKALGADIAIMDDGLQHRRLSRDVEIILLPQKDPFGKRAFFPRGELRDSLSRLKRADYIVITDATQEGFKKVELELRAFTSAPVIGTQAKVMEAKEICQKPFDLKKKCAFAYAAIAQPERFINTLKAAGAQVVDLKVFPDHATLSPDDLRELFLQAKHLDAECIVCTEKDAVKLPQDIDLPLPLVCLSIEHEVVFGKSNYKKLINYISSLKEEIRSTNPSDIDDKRAAVVG